MQESESYKRQVESLANTNSALYEENTKLTKQVRARDQAVAQLTERVAALQSQLRQTRSEKSTVSRLRSESGAEYFQL